MATKPLIIKGGTAKYSSPSKYINYDNATVMGKCIRMILLFILCFVLAGCSLPIEDKEVNAFSHNETGTAHEALKINDTEAANLQTINPQATEQQITKPPISLSDIPPYSGRPYTEINNSRPYFADSELSSVSYEYYSDLDSLGRCGTCAAIIGPDIMPEEERGAIGDVKPAGWHTVKYPGIIDGNYLYNRCHLIAFQLAGENANVKNLITGTRFLNAEGMLPFENKVAEYVRSSKNHVMYRVTPMFDKNNLVADGVLIEAESVEDNGRGISFNVFCYNVQPGISIDYATGDSAKDNSAKDGSIDASAKAGSTETEAALKPQQDETAPKPQGPENVRGVYAVNAYKNNGRIHITGKCPATGTDSNAMKNPIYFDTYEEAEAYSISINSSLQKRKCGNCW